MEQSVRNVDGRHRETYQKVLVLVKPFIDNGVRTIIKPWQHVADDFIPTILAHKPRDIEVMVREFEYGKKTFAIFKGNAGIGKTALAYALARAVQAEIMYLEAVSLRPANPGFEKEILSNDIGGIIKLAQDNPKSRYVVIIHNLDQIYGYGSDYQSRSVTFHFNNLIERSPSNIMYIGTTILYKLMDPLLNKHATHCFDIPYPSRNYRRAVLNKLLPKEVGANYQCDASLLDQSFLDRFADSTEGISIGEIIGLFSRAKGYALVRQNPHETLADLYEKRLASERARTQIEAISDDREAGPADLALEPKERTILMAQDLLKGLAEYKSELLIKKAKTSRWARYFSWIEKVLPFLSLFTQQVACALSYHQWQAQFARIRKFQQDQAAAQKRQTYVGMVLRVISGISSFGSMRAQVQTLEAMFPVAKSVDITRERRLTVAAIP
jgi:hypothetical protein